MSVLELEDVVEVHFGHLRAHRIQRIGGDLRLDVGEAVIGQSLAALLDAVVHREMDFDEDVVLGLRVGLQLHLVDHQVDRRRDALDDRDLDVEPGARDAGKLAEALDDRPVLLLDREQPHRDDDEGDDDEDPDEGCAEGELGGVHEGSMAGA